MLLPFTYYHSPSPHHFIYLSYHFINLITWIHLSHHLASLNQSHHLASFHLSHHLLSLHLSHHLLSRHLFHHLMLPSISSYHHFNSSIASPHHFIYRIPSSIYHIIPSSIHLITSSLHLSNHIILSFILIDSVRFLTSAGANINAVDKLGIDWCSPHCSVACSDYMLI